MYDMILSNLQQGKKEGIYRQELDENIISKLYVARIDSIRESELITDEEKMHPDFLDQIMEYHIRGIANEKGIRQFEQIKKQTQNQ